MRRPDQRRQVGVRAVCSFQYLATHDVLGIVKLSGIAMIDPQHTGFATGLERIILGVGQPDSA